MVEQWHQKSIAEKLQWYDNEIGSLANYLELKEPYSEKEKSTFRNHLKDITQRLEWDKQRAESKTGETARYLTVVANMYDRLPTSQTNPKKWMDQLYDAKEQLLKEYKVHNI